MTKQTFQLWELVRCNRRLYKQMIERLAIHKHKTAFKKALNDLYHKKDITVRLFDEFTYVFDKVNKQMQENEALGVDTYDSEAIKLVEETVVQRELYTQLIRHATIRDCMLAGWDAILDIYHQSVTALHEDFWPVFNFILEKFYDAFDARLEKAKKSDNKYKGVAK